MKLLIIEGPDRTGKNTLIQNLVSQADNNVVRHFGLPRGTTDKEMREAQYAFFDKEFQLASQRRQFDQHNLERYPRDIWIWNRGHLGEFVYGNMYRDTSPEKWALQIEKTYGFDQDPTVYLVLLTGNPEFLCKNDDGESFSAELDKKIDEITAFEDAFNKSSIVNKLHLSVTDETGENFRGSDLIFEDVNKFLFE